MKLYRIEDNMQVSQACPDPPFKAGKDSLSLTKTRRTALSPPKTKAPAERFHSAGAGIFNQEPLPRILSHSCVPLDRSIFMHTGVHGNASHQPEDLLRSRRCTSVSRRFSCTHAAAVRQPEDPMCSRSCRPSARNPPAYSEVPSLKNRPRRPLKRRPEEPSPTSAQEILLHTQRFRLAAA